MKDAGPLALVGGAAFASHSDFNQKLLEASGAEEVLVLPTAAAYEWPDRVTDTVVNYFAELGVKARGLRVLARADANDPEMVAAVRHAKFIYLVDGSPLHLRSVLKDTALWSAMVEAWKDGAAIAAVSAAATVLGDPMVDPRGGAFTLGLGMIPQLTVVPHWHQWTADKERRLEQLMPASTVVAELEDASALVRWNKGEWETFGPGEVILRLNHETVGLEALSEK